MDWRSYLVDIFDNYPEPIIIIQKDSTVIYVNKSYTQHFSVAFNKIIGRKIEIIEPNARFLECVKTGKPMINDYSYVESLKTHVLANICPIYDNGIVVGAYSILKNISEVNTLQNRLNEYKNNIKKLKQELNNTKFALLESYSPKMKKAVEIAKRISDSDVTVMIHGETGVGKEVFARAIHSSSSRRDKPFVPINMASIPESLFESELFGYEDGSFTGARKGGKRGIFEVANGGTLFLDEIGEFPLSMQVKLLRVLQERTFQKVGGTKSYPLDVRLIAATNRNLQEEITHGRFREDLYYRLNVVPIYIPPLRDRKEDIFHLVQNILGDLTTKYSKTITLSDDIFQAFKEYNWPGNVRELMNVLERMITTNTKTHIEFHDIHQIFNSVPDTSKFSYQSPYIHNPETINLNGELTLNEIIENIEENLLRKAIEGSKNRSEAISKLGISRKAFYSKIKKYNI